MSLLTSKNKILKFLILSLVLTSCSSACFRQEIEIPCHWHSLDTEAENPDCFRWWEGFDDPLLTQLIEEAACNNSDVRLAAWESKEKALEAVNVAASEIAKNYLELRGLQAQLQISLASIEIHKKLIIASKDLLNEGFIDQIELDSLKSNLNALLSQENTFNLLIKKTIFRLSTLSGYAPDCLSETLGIAQALPKLPGQMPVGSPMDLIQHHPSVQAARKIYQKACNEQTFYLYQKQVLASLESVENALAAFDHSKQEIQMLINTQSLQAETYLMIEELYRMGPKDERDLLQAYQILLNARLETVKGRMALLLNYVQVYAALSVGWKCQLCGYGDQSCEN